MATMYPHAALHIHDNPLKGAVCGGQAKNLGASDSQTETLLKPRLLPLLLLLLLLASVLALLF